VSEVMMIHVVFNFLKTKSKTVLFKDPVRTAL